MWHQAAGRAWQPSLVGVPVMTRCQPVCTADQSTDTVTPRVRWRANVGQQQPSMKRFTYSCMRMLSTSCLGWFFPLFAPWCVVACCGPPRVCRSPWCACMLGPPGQGGRGGGWLRDPLVGQQHGWAPRPNQCVSTRGDEPATGRGGRGSYQLPSGTAWFVAGPPQAPCWCGSRGLALKQVPNQDCG